MVRWQWRVPVGIMDVMPRARLIPWLLALAPLSACSCEGTELDVLDALLVPSSTALELGEVVVGTERTQTLTLTSAGGAPVTLTSVNVDGEGFGLRAAVAQVRLGPGETLEVDVRFAPARVGFVSGLLTVQSDASNAPSLEIVLRAAAVEPPDCDDANACTADAFDLNLEACVHPPQDGPCADPCLQDAVCVEGACVGTPLICPQPASACRQALCELGVGCVELDDPDACDDGNPCTVDTCDDVDGCGHTVVANGTPCGAIDGCDAAPVCVAGSCVDVPVPDGVPCDDGDLCTTGDVCQAGACVGLGALLDDPELTSSLPLGSMAAWAEVDGGLLVGATQNTGAGYELLLFTHSPGDVALTLIDRLPVTLSSYGAANLVRADATGVFSFADRPNGGTGLRLTEVTPTGFGATALVEGTGAIQGQVTGAAPTADATFLCLTETVGLGELWRVTLDAVPTAAATGVECQRLVDDGSGATAVVTYGLDLRRVTLTASPEILNDIFLPSFMLQTVTMFARGELVVFDVGPFDSVRVVSLVDESRRSLDDVVGAPRAFNEQGLWVTGPGGLTLWDLSDVEAPLLLTTMLAPPLLALTDSAVQLGATFASAGDRVAVRAADQLGMTLVTHPLLLTPEQIAVEGSGHVVLLGAEGASSVTLSGDGQLEATTGGQWAFSASGGLVHRGPAGFGPVWLLNDDRLGTPGARQPGEVFPQVSAPDLASPLVLGSFAVGDPLGSGGELQLSSDGRYLVGVQLAPDPPFGHGMLLVDALDVPPTVAGVTLPALAVEEVPLPMATDQSFWTGASLRLHASSRTFVTAHHVDRVVEDEVDDDGTQIVLGRYGPEGFSALASTVVAGDPISLAVGNGTALVGIEEDLVGSPDVVRLLRVDLLSDTELLVGEVTLDVPLVDGFDGQLLLWDGAHLVAEIGGTLQWFDIAPDGAGTLSGSLPVGAAIDVAVTDGTLLVLHPDRLSAVQPPCPAP